MRAKRMLCGAAVLWLSLAADACHSKMNVFSRSRADRDRRSGKLPGDKETSEDAPSISALGSVAPRAGERVTVTGARLKPGMQVMVGDKAVTLDVTDPEHASFVMPESRTGGLLDVRFIAGGVTLSKGAIFLNVWPGNEALATLDPAQVCTDVSFRNAQGALVQGTRDCGDAALAPCATDGQTNCRAVAAAPAVPVAGLAAKIANGQTVAGVAGVAPAKPADCGDNGLVGCVTTSAYKSADVTNLVATNIKSGVTVAGVTGTLAVPVANDLRAGVVVGGVTGTLKATCRDGVNSAYFNHDGLGTLDENGDTTGTQPNWWDTIDDATGIPSENPWSSPQYLCGPSNWTDVSRKTVGGAATTCADAAGDCMFRDDITRLTWTKVMGLDQWAVAAKTCGALAYGQLASGWRLPTQKEAMEAYVHGIRGLAGADFIPDVTVDHWTATSKSFGTGWGRSITWQDGVVGDRAKGQGAHYLCVHD